MFPRTTLRGDAGLETSYKRRDLNPTPALPSLGVPKSLAISASMGGETGPSPGRGITDQPEITARSTGRAARPVVETRCGASGLLIS